MENQNYNIKQYFERPIFVLGLPRSGTSLIAGALKINGAWLGKTVQGGGEENPRGFFENVFLREAVIKRILQTANTDPLGVKTLPDINNLPTIEGLEIPIRDMLNNEGYSYNQPWLFKDAKLSLVWPCFADIFPHAKWIIVRRNTENIVRSCLNTSFMKQQSQDVDFWNTWAKQYLNRLELLKNSSNDWYEIWPDNLIKDNFEDLKSLSSALNLKWNEAKIRKFICADYWHF